MTPESILSGALADELRAWLEFTTKTGQRLPCRPFRVVVEEVLAALASPAPQATPTMDDALAAGDGTLHGAIDYWQSRALAAEAKATGALSEQAKQLVAECTSYVNDLANWREDDSESRHEAAWQSAIMTIGQLAALSSAKREAEPMDMALCEIHSVVIRPGQTYTFSKVGDCEKCAAMENEAIEAYEPIGVTPLARAAASHKLAAPLAQSQLTEEIEALAVKIEGNHIISGGNGSNFSAGWSMANEVSAKMIREFAAAHGIVAPTLRPSEDKHG